LNARATVTQGFFTGSQPCSCKALTHVPRFVVVTGGPGAGKTAVLELVRRTLCIHIAVLPESASILFSGGFPRFDSSAGKRAGQRAIFRVQRELERLAKTELQVGLALCDRGTLDGLAYWPDDEAAFFEQLDTDQQAELARYDAVIHLRTPKPGVYNHSNPVRTESAAEAARIDERIERAWDGHPRRFFVESTPDFVEKATRAVEVIRGELPVCCGGAMPPAPPLPSTTP
jgi:predicted ATPase